MNKQIGQLLEQYHLQVTGTHAAGRLYGYQADVRLPTAGDPTGILLHVCFYASDEERAAVAKALSSSVRGLRASPTVCGVLLRYDFWRTAALLAAFPAIVEQTGRQLALLGAPGADTCPLCGKPFSGKSVTHCTICGFSVALDADCVRTFNAAVDAQDAAFDARPEGWIEGTCGALLGGLAGAVCTLLLYFLGYLSALSGAVSIWLGAFLYCKFGGKPDAVMLVTVGAIGLIFSCLGYLFATGAGVALETGLDLSAAFRALFGAMKLDAQTLRVFWVGFGVQAGFTAVNLAFLAVWLALKKLQTKKLT